MTKERVSLYDAVDTLLGPLLAAYARIVEEGDPAMPVTIDLNGRKHETTLAVLQLLDRAHQQAFDAKNARRAKKAVGALL